MSKIKTNQFILDINGEPVEREKLKKSVNDEVATEQLTLKRVCITALLTPKNDVYGPQGNQIVKGNTDLEKFAKWDLYKKFRDAKDDEVLLTSDDVVLLKKLITEYESQLICGQCRDMLEA